MTDSEKLQKLMQLSRTEPEIAEMCKAMNHAFGSLAHMLESDPELFEVFFDEAFGMIEQLGPEQ